MRCLTGVGSQAAAFRITGVGNCNGGMIRYASRGGVVRRAIGRDDGRAAERAGAEELRVGAVANCSGGTV